MTLRRSLAITVSAKYIEIGLSLVSSVVLARLLSPEDFGIYSIAASIALIGYLLRNFGVGQYLIQVEQVTDDMLRTAFSITLAMSWTVGICIALASGWIGDVYENPGVTDVLLFLAINFMLLPFGSVSNAMLRRNLAFNKLAVISVSAATASTVVGIASAWLGADYLAIVWATNAGTLVTIALNLWFRPPGLPWKPGLGAFREVSGFGLKVGLLDLTTKGGDSASELIIGKSHGLHDLGLYSRAYGAFSLFEYAFIEGIRPVVLPFLSEAKRNLASIHTVYRQIVAYISIFMVPFFIFLAFGAQDVVRVLYGSQWDASVPVLQVMCVAGLLLVPTIFFEQLLIAHSRPGLALRYQLVFQGTRLAALLLLVGGELRIAAVALVIGALAKSCTALYLATRMFGLRMRELAATLRPTLLTGLVVAVLCWGSFSASADWELPIVRLAVSGLVFGGAWLIAIFALGHPVAGEIRKVWLRLRPAV